jgi:ribonucleotide monophosphatase NagD (HAD superfamily)
VATKKDTVCVDLDGVLNLYDGFRGVEHFAEPRLGAAEFLDAIRVRGYKIAVLTTRKRTDVIDWLARVGLLDKIDTVTNEKVPALVYIDDRALCFRGDFDDALEQLKSFKAHWEAADEP